MADKPWRRYDGPRAMISAVAAATPPSVRMWRFDRADNRRFKARVAFFQIHRDLRVADLLANRTHERPTHEPEENGNREDAEGDDGAGREPERFEPARGEQQREQRAGDHDDGAARREFQAPAIPHAANDVNELQALVHAFLRNGQSSRD